MLQRCVVGLRLPSRATVASLRVPFRTMSTPSNGVPPPSAASSLEKKCFVLQYEYVPDILEKRVPFRAEHLQLAMDLKAAGSLVMAGAMVDPVDSALFIFKTNDPSEIEEFVANDPYVKNALVTGHRIREWNVAI